MSRLGLLLIAVAGTFSCARPVVYTRGREPEKVALIATRAVSRRHRLSVSSVGDTRGETRLCGPTMYMVPDDASFVALGPGVYDLGAKVWRFGGPSNPDLNLGGRVAVEADRCYSPAIVCEGDVYAEDFCHLVLEPTPCHSPWFGRRVVMAGRQGC